MYGKVREGLEALGFKRRFSCSRGWPRGSQMQRRGSLGDPSAWVSTSFAYGRVEAPKLEGNAKDGKWFEQVGEDLVSATIRLRKERKRIANLHEKVRTKGVSAGSDSVLVGFPVPKDSVLNYCKGEMHCMSSIVDAHDVAMYGLTGWLLRSDDEDSDFGDIQALWDAYVPKDDAGEAPDESVTGDTDEEVAIGNINVSEMFDIEMNGPERVWKREKMLTMAQAATGFHLTTTPAILFMPSDVVSIQVKKGIRPCKMQAFVRVFITQLRVSR